MTRHREPDSWKEMWRKGVRDSEDESQGEREGVQKHRETEGNIVKWEGGGAEDRETQRD